VMAGMNRMKADPTTEREIVRTFRSMMSAFMTLDPDDYIRHVSTDDALIVIGTGPDEIVHGTAELRTMLAAELAELRHMSTEFLWESVSRHGDVAWVTCEMENKATLLDGGVWNNRLRCLAVFVHQGGRWLATALHTSVPDASPAEGSWWPHSIERLASAVEQERPDLARQTASNGMVTLLFTDIEGSTELNTQLGDIRWMEALREHNAIVRERITAYEGTEIKTIGDAFMVAFPSARRAVLCALDLQRAFGAYNREHSGAEIRIRVGLHAGEPVREGNDFFGRCVTEASRITAVAKGGEVLVSSLLRELVDAAGDLMFDAGRSVELKGLPGARLVYAVSS
jgi:class 3 adenylate cyclase/ketosteroid isomerase-like protein